VVTLTDREPRLYGFTDVSALADFQRDMEYGLVLAGWTLVGFSPERRGGQERRRLTRLGFDRRRSTNGLLRPAVDIVGGHHQARASGRGR
jgi:hypothetical protein